MKRGRLYNKKGVSAVVATVLIVMITVAAVGLLWAIVSPFLKTNIAEKTACVDAEMSISIDAGSAYTCNSEDNGTAVRVSRGTDDNEWKAVEIVYTDSSGNSQKIRYAYPPSQNSEKVYRNVDMTDVVTVSVLPVILSGGDELVCSKTVDVANVKSCSNEVEATMGASSLEYVACASGEINYQGDDVLCLGDGLVAYYDFEETYETTSTTVGCDNPSYVGLSSIGILENGDIVTFLEGPNEGKSYPVNEINGGTCWPGTEDCAALTDFTCAGPHPNNGYNYQFGINGFVDDKK